MILNCSTWLEDSLTHLNLTDGEEFGRWCRYQPSPDAGFIWLLHVGVCVRCGRHLGQQRGGPAAASAHRCCTRCAAVLGGRHGSDCGPAAAAVAAQRHTALSAGASKPCELVYIHTAPLTLHTLSCMQAISQSTSLCRCVTLGLVGFPYWLWAHQAARSFSAPSTLAAPQAVLPWVGSTLPSGCILSRQGC